MAFSGYAVISQDKAAYPNSGAGGASSGCSEGEAVSVINEAMFILRYVDSNEVSVW